MSRLIGLDEAGLWCLVAGAFTSDLDANENLQVQATRVADTDLLKWLHP